MPRAELEPSEPELEAALEAIDATLAGDPVDPEHAELAELSLILRAERPPVAPPFAASLDRRVRERFARPGRRARRPRLRGWLVWAPAGAPAAVALVVALVTLVPGGGTSSSSTNGSAPVASSSSAAPASAGVGRGSAGHGSAGHGSAGGAAPASSSSGGDASAGSSFGAAKSARASSSAGSSSAGTSSATSASAAAPPPPPVVVGGGGRQTVQSARLALSTRPAMINAVAQQVVNTIGDAKGYVANSTVTATGSADSSAEFQLSVPSAALQPTLISLSQLHGATVVSSTGASNDITAQVGGAGRRLAEARALARSLLRQLAHAYTTQEVDSLKVQIRDANAAIDRDQAALSGLHRQVQYSKIALTIQGSAPAPPARGGGFTLPRAGHDAVRVLVVAAGGLLIALAVAVPLGLVAALVAWLGLRLRRQRRESALDRA